MTISIKWTNVLLSQKNLAEKIYFIHHLFYYVILMYKSTFEDLKILSEQRIFAKRS